MFNFLPQHLVAEVGTGVHHKGCLGRLHQYAGAETVVFFIGGITDFTFTADHGHTTAGAGTEESYG